MRRSGAGSTSTTAATGPRRCRRPPSGRRARPPRRPAGLTLEKLAIRFEGNVYDSRPWQGLFHWGVDWKRHEKYGTLDEVRSALKFERGGRAADFKVEDLAARDFRVQKDSPILQAGAYPKGEVPGVKLGAMPAR